MYNNNVNQGDTPQILYDSLLKRNQPNDFYKERFTNNINNKNINNENENPRNHERIENKHFCNSCLCKENGNNKINNVDNRGDEFVYKIIFKKHIISSTIIEEVNDYPYKYSILIETNNNKITFKQQESKKFQSFIRSPYNGFIEIHKQLNSQYLIHYCMYFNDISIEETQITNYIISNKI